MSVAGAPGISIEPRYLSVVILAGQNMKSVHPARVRRKVEITLCSQSDPDGDAFGEKVSGWHEPKGKTSGVVIFGEWECGMKADFPLNVVAARETETLLAIQNPLFVQTAMLRVRLLKSAVPARGRTMRELGTVLPDVLVDGIEESLDDATAQCEAEARLPLQGIIGGERGCSSGWIPLRRSMLDGDPELDSLEPTIYMQIYCTPDHDPVAASLKLSLEQEHEKLQALLRASESGQSIAAASIQQSTGQKAQEVYMDPGQLAIYQALLSPEEQEAYCQELLRLQAKQAGAPAAAPAQQQAAPQVQEVYMNPGQHEIYKALPSPEEREAYCQELLRLQAAQTAAEPAPQPGAPEPARAPAPEAMIDLMNMDGYSPKKSAEPVAAAAPAESPAEPEAEGSPDNASSRRGLADRKPDACTELAAAGAAPLVAGLDLPTLFGQQPGNRYMKWAPPSQNQSYLALDRLGPCGSRAAVSFGKAAKGADAGKGPAGTETLLSMEDKLLAGLGDSLKF